MNCTIMTPSDLDQRHELATFIRACRERLEPAAIGIPSGARRRTPGLRREEVAQLSGLSTTWFTWLEQGRDVSVSAAALSRLAKALRLTRAERAYLFQLSGKRDPGRDDAGSAALPAILGASVDAIRAPAYILDRGWNAKAWNDEAEALFVGWLDTPGDRNLLRYIFLNEAAAALIADFEPRARRIVAEFRADVGTHLDDPEIQSLVADLRRQSALFERLWDEHAVLDREGGRRSFRHPTLGFVVYEQVTFNLAHQPGLKLTMLLRETEKA
jgi:transcriptional regulator with XRE-family HTH domain